MLGFLLTVQIPTIMKQGDSRQIALPDSQSGKTGYYVYAKGGLMAREGNLSSAITTAY